MGTHVDGADVPLLVKVVTITVGTSFVLGVAAAAVGGPLVAMGEGFGGLGGVPAVVLLLSAVASPMTSFRDPRPRSWLTRGLWPLVVFLVFAFVADGVDPCVVGLLDGQSSIGEQQLCERFGAGFSIHTRFHLMLHAAVGAVAVWVARRLWPVWGTWPGGSTDRGVGH